MNKIVDTEKKNISYYSDSIKSAENKNFTSFLKWFNGGSNITSIINSGYYDFFVNVLKPVIYENTKDKSKELTCLEIGCGGGRMLNAACKYFGKAIGIDIHDSFTFLDKFMKLENDNYKLYRIENNTFPVSKQSIDFIYSFIVFQHILKINIFENYLFQIKRALKPSGIAIIYFGRPRFLSKKTFKSKMLNFIVFIFDRIFYEGLFLNIFNKGFNENYKVPVNHVNLIVSVQKAKKIFITAGLKVVEIGRSKNKSAYGTQYYFIATHK